MLSSESLMDGGTDTDDTLVLFRAGGGARTEMKDIPVVLQGRDAQLLSVKT